MKMLNYDSDQGWHVCTVISSGELSELEVYVAARSRWAGYDADAYVTSLLIHELRSLHPPFTVLFPLHSYTPIRGGGWLVFVLAFHVLLAGGEVRFSESPRLWSQYADVDAYHEWNAFALMCVSRGWEGRIRHSSCLEWKPSVTVAPPIDRRDGAMLHDGLATWSDSGRFAQLRTRAQWNTVGRTVGGGTPGLLLHPSADAAEVEAYYDYDETLPVVEFARTQDKDNPPS